MRKERLSLENNGYHKKTTVITRKQRLRQEKTGIIRKQRLP